MTGGRSSRPKTIGAEPIFSGYLPTTLPLTTTLSTITNLNSTPEHDRKPRAVREPPSYDHGAILFRRGAANESAEQSRISRALPNGPLSDRTLLLGIVALQIDAKPGTMPTGKRWQTTRQRLMTTLITRHNRSNPTS